MPERFRFRGFSKAIILKTSSRCLLLALFFLVSASASQSSSAREGKHLTVAYEIHVDPFDLSGFNVEMRIRGTDGNVHLAMAAHPEYDDRFWRYVENLSAESGGQKLTVTREEDALWSVRAPGGDVYVKYRIHLPARDEATRAAWRPFLSQTDALLGDLHSFMYVVGAESAPARVTLDIPDGWAIASGLDSTADPKTFSARTTELLLDSPIVVGKFQRWDFKAGGAEHTIIYLAQPGASNFDTASFVDGIQRLVNEAIRIFGKAPYDHYTFIYEDGADGALEHINSLTIGALSRNLQHGFADVFQVTAHEYFHTWNLMRVRPVERIGVRFRHAEPTPVLWWSEGVTIYFSDLLLRRAQLPVPEPTRIAHLESKIATYLLTPGYTHISPERVSLASDDPLALGDDFSSVYLQGELLGAMLDLMVREKTSGRRSLDDVMRSLSERFTPERGITDADIEQAVHDVCNCDSHSFFESYVRSAGAIDFDRYLQSLGLRTQVSWSAALDKDGKPAPDLRIFLFSSPADPAPRIRLTSAESAWGRAGLHTGDSLLSVDGRPVTTPTAFRQWLNQLRIGQTARLEVLHGGVRSTVEVPVKGYDRPTVKIQEIAGATPEQQRLREQWAKALH
ncbi:MAG TPA: PDZ domain-containing protein [Pyrinomonadaceae bacterium]|nr:PDZ domain-containing protein [Pyrinomonadaceae bacterium]